MRVPPIVFRGSHNILVDGATYFDLKHGDPMYGGFYQGCMGYAAHLLDGHASDTNARALFHDDAPIVTWGFYGPGTKLLAATMLALSLKSNPCYWPREAWLHPERDLIIELHDKYAREVLAKLPPNWTITGKEVKAWVKQQTKEQKQTKETNADITPEKNQGPAVAS